MVTYYYTPCTGTWPLRTSGGIFEQVYFSPIHVKIRKSSATCDPHLGQERSWYRGWRGGAGGREQIGWTTPRSDGTTPAQQKINQLIAGNNVPHEICSWRSWKKRFCQIWISKTSFLHAGPQCCGSGMFIPDPGSWFLPIPDPGSKNSYKREGWKKKLYLTFFCSHKFHKCKIILFLNCSKKNWAKLQRIKELFTQKVVAKLSKIWVWDPGSEIRDPEWVYSGSRIQGSKRHRIPDPDPQHWLVGIIQSGTWCVSNIRI